MRRDSSAVGLDRELEDLEIDLLLTAIARRYGYDFRQYSKASLKRRVRRAVQEERVHSISGLQERLLHDLDALRRFISILSVHVTSLFRDPAFYRTVRRDVVPVLRTYPLVRTWVAGCSTGEDVYSLAILLMEEGLYDRARIYATDISDDLLEQASVGTFSSDRLPLYAQNYQRAGGRHDFEAYCHTHGRKLVFDSELRRNVVFSQHNLASDAAFNEFQLILCRNVMIYFDQTLRQRVHEMLHQSLCMFGILGLGTRESIRFTPVADCYQALDPDLRLYRKIR